MEHGVPVKFKKKKKFKKILKIKTCKLFLVDVSDDLSVLDSLKNSLFFGTLKVG